MNIPDMRRPLLAVLAAILFNLLFPLPPAPMNTGAAVLLANSVR
jgi:hypothetical protein